MKQKPGIAGLFFCRRRVRLTDAFRHGDLQSLAQRLHQPERVVVCPPSLASCAARPGAVGRGRLRIAASPCDREHGEATHRHDLPARPCQRPRLRLEIGFRRRLVGTGMPRCTPGRRCRQAARRGHRLSVSPLRNARSSCRSSRGRLRRAIGADRGDHARTAWTAAARAPANARRRGQPLWFGAISIGSLTVPSWISVSENAARCTAGWPRCRSSHHVRTDDLLHGRPTARAADASELGFL